MSRYSYDSVTDTLKLISGATQANDIYISGIEESSTASQAYTVGSYLIYSKVLYKVILAIAQGDTLTPGTNIQSTRVADELVEINSAIDKDGDLDLLASGSSSSSWSGTNLTTVTLNGDLKNYKEIIAFVYNTSDGNLIVSGRLPISIFSQGNNIYGVYSPSGNVAGGLRVIYVSDTQVKVNSFGYSGYKIYGMK